MNAKDDCIIIACFMGIAECKKTQKLITIFTKN